MRRWNTLSAGVAVLALLSATCAAQIDEVIAPPNANEAPTDSPAGAEGRALFDLGILKRISKFFGWDSNNRKSSREPPIYRRPEMLPFEILSSENRRSEFNHLQSQHNLQGDFQATLRPKKWTPNERVKPAATHDRKGPFYKRTTYHVSSFEPPSPVFKTLDASSQNLPKEGEGNGVADNFVKLDRTGERDYLFAKESIGIPFQHEIAMVESREPVVAVYTGGEKQQFSQSERKKDENHHVTVHSKFALENYSPKLNTQPVNPYLKDPVNPYVEESLPLREVTDSSKQSPKKPHRKDIKTYKEHNQKVKRIRPYMFRNQNSVHKPAHISAFQESPFPLKKSDSAFVYSAPSWGNHVRAESEEKEKGFFDNVSSFASNFFGKLLPKSSPSTTPPRFKRRHRNNYPSMSKLNLAYSSPALSLNLPPRSDIKAKDDIGERSFDPSPQQGIIAEDVFQPLFVPSYSMDGKLPNDAMKPLIIPQQRTAEAAPIGPSKPEMIDFF